LKRLTERFETHPGRQARMDWGECGVIQLQGVRRKLYVYSRMLFVKFTSSTRHAVLQQCL
jgi:transposase